MVIEQALRQTLQFLITQPNWVLRDLPNCDQSEVMMQSKIPARTGNYWVAGETRLRIGRKIESVFRVDTNGGGSLAAVFWKINGQWYRHEDFDTLPALGVLQSEVFPFDWSFAVPLEEDIFHPTPDSKSNS